MATIAFRRPGQRLILIGATAGHLGQSLYLRELFQREEGPPPPVDLAAERANGDFVRAQIASGKARTCHDLSDGGLFVALAEMAMAGSMGATIAPPPTSLSPHAWLFGEDQGRYLLAVAAEDADEILAAATAANVPAAAIGETGGPHLTVTGLCAISVDELRRRHEAWMPRYMDAQGA
jgi:phosphoribosylformylglycinamidine synthase